MSTPPPPPRPTPTWLLPPSRPAKDWWKNPWVIGFGILFAIGLVGAYWYVVIPLALVGGGATVWYFRRQYRQHEYDRLRAAADHAYRNGEVLPPRPPWET